MERWEDDDLDVEAEAGGAEGVVGPLQLRLRRAPLPVRILRALSMRDLEYLRPLLTEMVYETTKRCPKSFLLRG